MLIILIVVNYKNINGGIILMKVAILTITNGQNYGNRLQNYATQALLNSLGVEAETVINTTNQNVINDKNIIGSFKYIVATAYSKILVTNLPRLNKILRRKSFNDFNEKYIKFSSYIISRNNIPDDFKDKYDYFICGSDQVWNPNFIFNSEIDFLTFAKSGQRIAYSPSFGISELPNSCKDNYRKWLTGMDYLSVREEAGARIIKEIADREAIVLLDPTFMLCKNEWLKIAKKPKFISNLDKKFILTYFLGNKDRKSDKKINDIAKKHNLKIINLMDINDKNIYSVNPSEFIWLINNCELMCTDSFHGVVFSLILKTHFIVFERKSIGASMNSRLETLLSKFDMENRLDKNIINDNEVFNVDFSNVDEIINYEKERSFQYLKNALNIK